MKKIHRPEPNRIDCNANHIQGYLDRRHTSQSKNGSSNRTLYGCFKFIATSPMFASLGDYPILAQCVEWMKKSNQKVTEKEIYRSLKYFQDYNPNHKRIRKQMSDSLANLSGDI